MEFELCTLIVNKYGFRQFLTNFHFDVVVNHSRIASLQVKNSHETELTHS